MKDYNKKDLFRYEGVKCHSVGTQLRYLLFVPGFQYSWCFRNAQNASCRLTVLFWCAFLRILMYLYGIQIPYQTLIGEGLRISHWGTIVVNPNATIGKNFSISPGCTIGRALGKKEGVPSLGDNVIMNANSIVVGGGKYWERCFDCPRSICQF